MNFGFTEEQELLRAEVRKFLDQNAPLDQVRKMVETPEGFDRALWNRMAELGWVGLTVPEVHGGVGLDLVTAMVLLEETGRTLFPSPLISSLLASQAIQRFGSEAQQAAWLPGLADGTRIGSFALVEASDDLSPRGVALRGKADGDDILLSGSKTLVPDGAVADVHVVAFRSGDAPEALSLAVVEGGADGLTATELTTMDLSKRTARLDFADVRIGGDALLGEAGAAWPAIRWLVDLGAALVTAESVGAAENALAITTRFAQERIQFGQPIGRFQGVKHPLAEMYVDIESVKSLVYYAVWAIDEGEADAPRSVSRAKALASDVFPGIGISGVQLHGGVGYTWEYDIQLYLKRGKWMRPLFGDADHHYERLARMGDL
jgi:alkylation response protein AidB-like acyl-CoA dehydrogenase